MKLDYRMALLALTLAISACNSEKPPAAAGTAGGEVLPGSVSDAMLPVDTVRSQPPLAPMSDSGDANREGGSGGKPSGKAGGKPADKPGSSGRPAAKAVPPKPPAEAPSEPRPGEE